MRKHLYLFKYGVKWAMKNGSRVVQNATVFLLFYIKKKKKKPSTQPQHLLLGTKYINLPCLATVNLPFIWENYSHDICYKRKPQEMDTSYCIKTMRMCVWRQCECDYAITQCGLKRSCVKTVPFTHRVDVGQVKERPRQVRLFLNSQGEAWK